MGLFGKLKKSLSSFGNNIKKTAVSVGSSIVKHAPAVIKPIYSAAKPIVNQVYSDVKSGVSGATRLGAGTINKALDSATKISTHALDVIPQTASSLSMPLAIGGAAALFLLMSKR